MKRSVATAIELALAFALLGFCGLVFVYIGVRFGRLWGAVGVAAVVVAAWAVRSMIDIRRLRKRGLL